MMAKKSFKRTIEGDLYGALNNLCGLPGTHAPFAVYRDRLYMLNLLQPAIRLMMGFDPGVNDHEARISAAFEEYKTWRVWRYAKNNDGTQLWESIREKYGFQ